MMKKPYMRKSKFFEVYYKDIKDGRKTRTLWAWYNFDEGYGLVKRYTFDHRYTGSTMRSDAPTRLNPPDDRLNEVKGLRGGVDSLLILAKSMESQLVELIEADKDESGEEAYNEGGKLE